MLNRCCPPPTAIACALFAAVFPLGAVTSELIPMYGAVVGGPSVGLSSANSASPYSGIGRYEGLARCTAFFLDTAGSFVDPDDPAVDSEEAPAYAVTEGRCAADLAGDSALIDGPGQGHVVFNYFADSTARQVVARVARTAYASVQGRNVAVLELAPRYAELVTGLIRPLPAVSVARMAEGDPVVVVGAPLGSSGAEDFVRLAFCRIDGIAAVLLEDRWRWVHAPFNRCRDVRIGSAGSPVLSVIARGVVGLIVTTTAGGERREKCALGRPCEPTEGRKRSRPDTHYLSSLAGIGRCFDATGRFDITEGSCSLRTPAEPRDDRSSARSERPPF